ncbi:MAG: DUF6161 domain-containing protein [Alloalcanivorax sp.]
MDVNQKIRDRAGQEFSLQSSPEAKSFLQAEVDFWDKKKAQSGGSLPGNLAGVSQQIKPVLDKMQMWEDAVSAEKTPGNLPQLEQNFRQSMSNLANWMAKNWVYRGGAFVEAMLSAHQFSPDSGNAFLETIVNKKVSFPNHQPPINVFIGALLAYEYLLQDESQLAKRRNAEKKAFSTLRNDLEKERDRLVAEVEEFRRQTDDWRSGTEETFKAWFERIQGDSGKWFTFVKERSDKAIEDHSAMFKKMSDYAIGRTKELEELYSEQLRLAAPATYWERRAKDLQSQGRRWARLMVLVSLLAMTAAGAFFWTWLQQEPVPFGLHSLQGVALFGATAAAAVFLIRMLSRLAFSAFHLQRDAEERLQLTHLYLSLIHENAVDTQARDVVLQALFSRADSGLLSGDHGPTMPNTADIIAGLSRVRPS